MQLPDQDFWLAIGALVASAVSFAFYVERKFLPKGEHARMCTERNEVLRDKLEDIHAALAEQKTDTRAFQEDMRNSVHGIQLSVMVLKTKLGMKETHSERN